ncbi:MAG TPA: DnaJ domain-containing protein [Verrucomicrobiae bacterium]|jgi:curved DNA-binding protein CbpA|nr:DnaJ domain-containing protein [Verrucomicrobiae bacterium]
MPPVEAEKAPSRASMTDYFKLLEQPRRPWLDADSLKQTFLARSAQLHPDRVHNAPEAERQAAAERYAELNSAYQCLREPKERLRHLLELESGARSPDIQQVPPELTEPFFEIGRLCREADTLIAEKEKKTSPILQARLFERGAERTDELLAMQRKIGGHREELMAELKALNAAWESPAVGTPLPLARLEEIRRRLGYFARWSEQIQERLVKLSF